MSAYEELVKVRRTMDDLVKRVEALEEKDANPMVTLPGVQPQMTHSGQDELGRTWELWCLPVFKKPYVLQYLMPGNAKVYEYTSWEGSEAEEAAEAFNYVVGKGELVDKITDYEGHVWSSYKKTVFKETHWHVWCDEVYQIRFDTGYLARKFLYKKEFRGIDPDLLSNVARGLYERAMKERSNALTGLRAWVSLDADSMDSWCHEAAKVLRGDFS